MRLFTAAILTTLILCLCVGNSKTSSCIADVENAMCSISKDGTAMLTVQNYPSNTKLLDARISPCEITGRLWSCEEIGWKVKYCEIISESQPFKAKCPIESGAWSVKFRILKPEGEETIRIYQIV